MHIDDLKVSTGNKFKLSKHKPDDTHGVPKAVAEKASKDHAKKLSKLHDLLYAEHKRSLLVVLQGTDASGKDGTIRKVISGVNPQGCSVVSFKQPSTLELDHDFLWRIHHAIPPKGTIGIFNRSQYEDVLIARVHELVPPKVWKKRYDQINDFEKMLSQNDVHILKFFLHISNAEQERRFQDRLLDPDKNWKASAADFKEREYWDQYQDAYQDAVEKCSTKHAPWYVIPANHKWFRDYVVGEIIVNALESFQMSYPRREPEASGSKTSGGIPQDSPAAEAVQ